MDISKWGEMLNIEAYVTSSEVEKHSQDVFLVLNYAQTDKVLIYFYLTAITEISTFTSNGNLDT